MELELKLVLLFSEMFLDAISGDDVLEEEEEEEEEGEGAVVDFVAVEGAEDWGEDFADMLYRTLC